MIALHKWLTLKESDLVDVLNIERLTVHDIECGACEREERHIISEINDSLGR